MKFLDRKEQVLELQMTQYGKGLMSRVTFQPAYYAFFDDDVVYDSEYMSTNGMAKKGNGDSITSTALENSVDTSDRIRNAIRTEVQYNYAGVESWINKEKQILSLDSGELVDGFLQADDLTPILKEIPLEGGGTAYQSLIIYHFNVDDTIDEILQAPPTSIDNYHNMGLPMGTSEHNTSKAPAWKLNFHSGEITNLNSEDGQELYTGAGGLLQIPQIDVEAVYDIKIKPAPAPESQEDVSVDIYTFPDNSYIKVEKEHILVDVGELNSIFENENFDIEVYEVIEGAGWITPNTPGLTENLRPLYFMKKEQANESLFDNPEFGSPQTTSNVEYYLDVMVDEEIQENITISQQMQSVYDTPSNDDKEPC